VAAVLPNGWFLPLGSLALMMPDMLAGEIEELDLATVMALDPTFGVLRAAMAAAEPQALEEAALDPASVRLASPIPKPGKILGVGYNYLDHIREQGMERPVRPVRHPGLTHALDLEAELAVVVGRRAHRVRAADALRCVAGYTAANDVTARDWQGQQKALRPGEAGDGQWLRAKSSDTFLPLGPFFVTADELGDGRGLYVRSWRTAASGPNANNPFQMQNGNTKDLLFGVAELISIISQEVTLAPGDIVITGTPSGVGVFREPQVFLEPGDLVSVEVERIGKLTNPVVDTDGQAPADSPAARAMAERDGQIPLAQLSELR
jgi:5-carboxymethyl-2-hydroxymuconate isomerase